MKELDLIHAIALVRLKFGIEVDLSSLDSPMLSFNNIFKARYQNSYVVLRENARDNLLEVTFFKSDQQNDKLFDDYIDLGICFYPKTVESLQTIIKAIDA